MAAASPSPNSPPLTVPPAPVSTTTTPPPPQASSPPPRPPTSSPSSQPNANPPETTNLTASSPLTPPSPPPTMPLSPPPQPPVVLPPQLAPPMSPPSNPRSPPPTPSPGVPPTSTSGSSPPPESSPLPPAPSSTPPMGSPPPPSFFPTFNSPPPPSPTPPKSSPPPPLAESPQTPPPPPPPPSTSPESPPPTPAFPPLQSPSPPPPPISFPPISSPSPTPPFIVPRRSPPPPALPPWNATPPPAPGSNPTPPPANPPPSSPIHKHPPPSSPTPHPSHSRVPISPPDGATLNDTVHNLPGSAIIDDGGIGTGGVIAIGVVAGLIVLSLIGFVVWLIKKKNQNITGHGGHIVPYPQRTAPVAGPALKAHSPAPIGGIGRGSNFVGSPVEPRRLGNPISCFTFQVLYEATSGFSDQNLLGQGGSGSVYKGILSDGKEIAVKQLKTSGGQGEEEFKAEVKIVSRIHHRHLVSLVGYCISSNRRLLVFDYVPNNTLHYHLHGEGRPVLDWATRLKVAIGAARGIAYLHEDCHPRVIHRDIKSSNILLDENFKARVSDFGLAKVAPDGQTHVSTGLAGTFGYVAPEYASSGKVTEKSDVYSYGVVLLELITGRKPLDTSQSLDDPSLVAWARPLLHHALDKDEVDGLVDPRLERNYVQKEMHTMIRIAAACVRHSSARRPQMGDVVKVFDNLAAVDINNGLKAGESEVVNAAQLKQLQRWAFGVQDYTTDIPSKGSSKRRNSRLKIGQQDFKKSSPNSDGLNPYGT